MTREQWLRGPLRAAWALVGRASGSVLQFIVSVLAGRVLGPAGAGLYFVYLSWTGVLGTVAGLGLPMYLLREVAFHRALGAQSTASGLARSSVVAAATAGAVIAGVLGFGAEFIAKAVLGRADLAFVLRIAGFGAAGLAVVRVLAEVLKAAGRTVPGFLVEFHAPLTGAALALLICLVARIRPGPAVIPMVYTGTLLAVAVVGSQLLMRAWPSPESRPRWQRRSLAVFLGIGVLTNMLAGAPYFLLPRFTNDAGIGQFGVAHRLVAFSATINFALGGLFGPDFARLHAARDHQSLGRALRSSQVYALLSYLPLLVAYTVFPRQVLVLFGTGFAEAREPLIIMALGRVASAVGGPSEQFLRSTGNEAADLAGAGAALVAFAALGVLFGRWNGAVGVAWAYALAFAMQSSAYQIYAHRWLRRRSLAVP